MAEPITLAEFRRLAAELPTLGGVELDAKLLYVEPLEGRSTIDVDRRCIIEKDGKRFVTRWD